MGALLFSGIPNPKLLEESEVLGISMDLETWVTGNTDGSPQNPGHCGFQVPRTPCRGSLFLLASLPEPLLNHFLGSQGWCGCSPPPAVPASLLLVDLSRRLGDPRKGSYRVSVPTAFGAPDPMSGADRLLYFSHQPCEERGIHFLL